MKDQKKKTIELSLNQKQVVEFRGSALQVIACAGSGKTESIARRAASLITEEIPPESIIAFTFTEKAATELKDRIYRRVEIVMGADYLGRLGPMFVGTIHGYCYRLLQTHVPKYGNYDVLDEHRHTALVSRRRHELGLTKLNRRHWKSVEIFLRAVGAIENELIPISQIENTDLAQCYTSYLKLLDRLHFLTFGMIIASAVEVLETNKDIYKRVHSSLRHLIVDEYQDINPAQERLIDLLSKNPVELCVVGDDDQAIYQWRGSDVQNIIGFAERYKGAQTIKLETNRRSRPKIVPTANEFAKTIQYRLEKVMDSSREAGELEVFPWLAQTPGQEAEVIADHITRLHMEGWRYRDMAILYRSVRTSAPPLVTTFEDRGIPFNCGGRTGLFLHPEINHFGELFAWISGFSWQDERFGPSRDADLNYVVEGLVLSFNIPVSQKNDLKQYFNDWKSWHAKGNRRVNLVGDFYQHLKMLGIKNIDPDTSLGSVRIGAFARFLSVLADYEHVTLRSRWITTGDGKRVYRSGTDRGKNFWTGLANYLLHYAQESYEDFEGESIHGLDAVSILTVHQAKGLEWPVLFLPSLTNRRFPSSMSGNALEWAISEDVFPDQKRIRYEGSDADERRLFYVALTRARDVLYASSFKRISKAVGRSPYLLELAKSVGVSSIPELNELPLFGKPEKGKSTYIPPFELGYSDLADYEECGFVYRLSRVFGFERELVPELGYGRAVHHVLRHIAEDARKNGEIPSKEEIENLLKQELYIPFANQASYTNMKRSIRYLIQRYIKDWSDDLRRVWATERPFEIHLNEGIVAGRADVILDREEGKPDHLAIVDYKAATDQHRDERYAMQLMIYAAAGRQEGLEVDACYLHELKNSHRSLLEFNQETIDAAITWAAERVKEICSGLYTPQTQQTKVRTL